jgi:hypothetical protein
MRKLNRGVTLKGPCHASKGCHRIAEERLLGYAAVLC